ncbi:MAG: hypothetical protein SVR94_09340 [Pseudomonadota bacterium]|nr:hypothetical protein [Pseudomonadota bacterium]
MVINTLNIIVFTFILVSSAYAENLKTSKEHIDSVHKIAEVIERFKEKTGNYPFIENWSNVEEGYVAVPISSNLTTRELPEEFRYPPRGVSGVVIPAKEFEKYLSNGLKEKVVLPKDDRKIRSPRGNWPFFYQYLYDGKNYFVSCFLQEKMPNTRRLGRKWYKYEVGSIAVPGKNILRYSDVKK